MTSRVPVKVQHSHMVKGDFFSFITSLKPIELKAIGELSQVMHLDEGVTIYSSGHPSDAVYIINRGAVEVVHENPRHADRVSISYLSRGDMFGEVGVLTGTPRMNAIRTCEPVSIQCFKSKDFPELIRRVPSFFYYLSQQVASQLVKVTDLAFVESNCLELSGNLANFDLVTIYQTILNSSQTGELAIVNEDGETVALFSFEKGQATYAQFYHLTGEEAFWQLFLHEKLSGTFSFSITEGGGRQLAGDPIQRHPTDLLIRALQYRDEFKILMESIPDPASALHRTKLNLDWPDTGDDELRALAEAVWQKCYSSPLTMEHLYTHFDYCELKFYKTIVQLLRTGHFALILPGEEEVAMSNNHAPRARVASGPARALRASPVLAMAAARA